MCAESSELRSPLEVAAARFNPPVHTVTWYSDREYLVHELLVALPERVPVISAHIDGILHHESIFVGRSRLRFAEPTTTIPAQTEIKILWFESEPEALNVTATDIVHEDEHLVVVNKPAWLPTQGIPSSARFSLECQLRTLLNIPTLMAVHRLDRQTSGVVVFAKDGAAAGRYMQLFAERHAQKKYLAVTTATPAQAQWTMQGYLHRDFQKLPRVLFRLADHEVAHSRWSETHFRVVRHEDGRTLLEAMPVTGRTHQIRVHLAASQCYVWGDTTYGYPAPHKHAPASRLQLHAWQLSWPEVKRWKIPALHVAAEPSADFLMHVPRDAENRAVQHHSDE